MDKNLTRNIAIAFVASLTASLAAVAAAATQPATAGASLLVLNGDGRYLELDPASGRSLASGLYGDLMSAPTRLDGPMIEDVLRADDKTLYAVLARDAQADSNGTQRFSVAALDSRTLKVIHSYDLAQPQTVQPRLLMGANGAQLLLLTESGIQALAIHADGGIEPTGTMMTPDHPLPTSPEIYLDARGKIVDGYRVFDRQGHLQQEVRPDSVLDASLRDQFAALTQIKGSTDHYYGTILAASAGDRMVFTVGWDREDTRIPHAGIAVYDLNAGRVISSFYSEFPVAPGDNGEPGVPTLQLSPDGQRIVVEQYEWRPRFTQPRAGEESRESRFRTGKLAIYRADTGALIGTVALGGPASNPRAEGRVIGYSRDASQLYYWFDKHLAVIDLQTAQVISKSTLPDGYDPVAVIAAR